MSLIKELESLVLDSKNAYYNTGNFLKLNIKSKYPKAFKKLVELDKNWSKRTSVVTINDDIFDSIEKVLKTLKPNSKALNVGAKVERMKVELPFYMGSLDKIKPGSVSKWLNANEGPYLVMDKEDGLSIGLEFDGDNVKAFTRGNGFVGQDITQLSKMFKIPKSSKFKHIRGEIIMSKQAFESKWKKEFENPRNMASGLVNRKDIHKGLKDIDVIVYEVVSPRGTPSKQLKVLKSEGFQVVPFKVFDELSEQNLIEYYEERRKKSKYAIDGLVVMQDKKTSATKSGNPKNAVAFKTKDADEEVEAEVVRVEWNASRTGQLKPRCEIKPVRISGVTVTYATCHNAAFVRDNGIGKGAIISLVRSGQVIPYITKVIKKVKPQLPNKKEFGEWEWNDTEVDIILIEDNEDVDIKKITHFFTTLGVENFSSGLISRFYNLGFDSIEKIIKMSKKDMLKIEGIKNTLADKIINNIKSALKEVYLPSYMDATGLFGRNFGTKRMELILDKFYPEIMKWKNKPNLIESKILTIPGFKSTLAKQFAANFNKFTEFHQILNLKYYYDEKDTIEEIVSDKLLGQRIYITGFRDDELSELIKMHGGEEGGFTGKTTILIVKKGTNNSKTSKAKDSGIPILTKDQFLKKFEIKSKEM